MLGLSFASEGVFIGKCSDKNYLEMFCTSELFSRFKILLFWHADALQIDRFIALYPMK